MARTHRFAAASGAPGARPFARSPLARPSPSRARRAAMLLAALSLLAGGRRADADDVEVQRAQLREGAPSSWPMRMDAIGRSAELVGAVVGPMLRDREPRHVTVTAFAAAWLCDHPASGRVLLDEEILRRGALDPTFVAEVRAALAVDGLGWGRLVAAARANLAATTADPSLSAAAAAFLRHESTASNVRELLDIWESAADPTVRSTARESLGHLLGVAFDDPVAARRVLDADRGRSLLDWVRDLSIAKDRPDAPRFQRLLAEASSNLERVRTPEGLRPYLLPSTTPWPELRRLAAARAKVIDPTADGWTALLTASIGEETDAETLDTLLHAFGRIRIDVGAGATLAERAANRLAARPPPEDGPAVGFLAVLGRLGTAEQRRAAFETLMARGARTGVLLAWLDAASIEGASAEIRSLHRSRAGQASPDAELLRVRALGALARGGAETEGDAAANAAFLAEIVERRAASAEALAASTDERAAALRALEAFPLPQSAAALVGRAIDPTEEPSLSRLSASVLGRLASKEAREDGRPLHAASAALVAVARSGTVPARISAIEDLARIFSEGVDHPADVTEACRQALDAAGPLDLRGAAARAAAALSDASALPSVLALASDEARAAETAVGRRSGLAAADRLVRWIAARDDTRDGELALLLRTLLDAGPDDADAAVTLAAAASDAGGGRAALQAMRTRVLLRRSRAVGRSLEQRLLDVDEAHRVLDATMRAVPEAELRTGRHDALIGLDREIRAEALRHHTARLRLARDPSPGGARVAVTSEAARVQLAGVRSIVELVARWRADTGYESAAAAAARQIAIETLEGLRESLLPDVRRAALIESAGAEWRLRSSPESSARAKVHLGVRPGARPDRGRANRDPGARTRDGSRRKAARAEVTRRTMAPRARGAGGAGRSPGREAADPLRGLPTRESLKRRSAEAPKRRRGGLLAAVVFRGGVAAAGDRAVGDAALGRALQHEQREAGVEDLLGLSVVPLFQKPFSFWRAGNCAGEVVVPVVLADQVVADQVERALAAVHVSRWSSVRSRLLGVAVGHPVLVEPRAAVVDRPLDRRFWSQPSHSLVVARWRGCSGPSSGCRRRRRSCCPSADPRPGRTCRS